MSKQNEVELWRGALIPAVTVAALSIFTGVLIKGRPGLLGALLAR